MKRLFLVTVGLLVATPALAQIPVPNDGNGVRKNGYCVIEFNHGGQTAYYLGLCSDAGVTCQAGWGTDCTIEGSAGELYTNLPWTGPKKPRVKPPGDEPGATPKRSSHTQT